MRPLVSRLAPTALTALGALVTPLAQAELSITQLQGLIALEETRSGSLLPFPMEGRPGVIVETETGFEVRYDALFNEGFALLNPVFVIEETETDTLQVSLSDYSLDADLSELWDSMDPQFPLPSFSGEWSVQDQTYLSYEIDAPFGFTPAPEGDLSGTLTLSASSGTDGGLVLNLNDLNISAYGEPIATLEALTLDITATDLDPYRLTTTLLELADQLSYDPSAAMGLIPAYTNLILGSEAEANLTLTDLSLQGLGIMSGTLETASLTLSKNGQNMLGEQGIALSLSLNGAEGSQSYGYGDPYETFGFDTLELSQEISVENILGALAQGASLYSQLSNANSLSEASVLANNVGRFLNTLAPRITSEVSIEGFYQSSRIAESETELQSASSRFVFDLKDEIRLEGAINGFRNDSDSPWYQTSARVDEASFSTSYELWDSFVMDATNLTAQSLVLSDELARDFAQNNFAGGPIASIGFAGLMVMNQGVGLGGYTEANASNIHFAQRSEWDSFGYAIDSFAYRQGAEAREVGSRWHLDASLGTLIVAQSYADDPIFFTRDNLQALKESGGDELMFALDSVTHDLDIDTQPWGPYLQTLLGLIAQGRQVEEQTYEAYKPLIRQLAIATLNQFDGYTQRADVNGLYVPAYEGDYSWDNRPGVTIGSAGIDLVWTREQMTYFLGLEGFDLDRGAMEDIPAVSLDSAIFESNSPALPDGYGVDLINYYLDTLAMTLDPYGDDLMTMTWADYLDSFIYDTPYTEASASIQGLHIDMIQDHLSASLADLSLVADGSSSNSPPAYDLGYRVNWSGLTSTASAPEAQAFLSALLPEQGVMDFSFDLGLKPGGYEALATIPVTDLRADQVTTMQDASRALEALDIDVSLQELFIRSSAWQLEGEASFLPEVEANPEAIESWRDSILDALVITPNLDGGLHLSGLEQLETAQQKVLSAKPLGPLEFMREMAQGLSLTLEYLKALGVEQDGALTYELSMEDWGDLLINGQSVL